MSGPPLVSTTQKLVMKRLQTAGNVFHCDSVEGRYDVSLFLSHGDIGVISITGAPGCAVYLKYVCGENSQRTAEVRTIELALYSHFSTAFSLSVCLCMSLSFFIFSLEIFVTGGEMRLGNYRVFLCICLPLPAERRLSLFPCADTSCPL